MNYKIASATVIVFLFVLLISTFAELVNSTKERSICPPKHVCINPENVTCFVFDMGVDRWKTVRDRNHRQKVSVDVYYGKAEYKRQMQGVDCYEIDKHFMLGDKVVATLPVDWWRSKIVDQYHRTTETRHAKDQETNQTPQQARSP